MVLNRRIASLCVITCGWLVRSDLRWQLLACGLSCFLDVASAEVIRLGGPRDIVVDVEDVRGGFSVTVEMQPVSCFDPATNARINRSKARLYGLAGIGKSLDIAPDRLAAGHDISGVEVDAPQQNGARYRFRLFVPESVIAGQEQPLDGNLNTPAADAATAPDKNRSQLFSCVDDHAKTIEELKAAYNERLAETENNAIDALAGTIAGDHLKTAREALSSLDAEAKEAFKAVEQEFGADLRVLTVEMESLAKLLATARADFEASRKKAYARIEEAAGRAAEAIDPALTSPEATDPRSVK